MDTPIRKLGNSLAVIIPEPLLAGIGIKAGDRAKMTVRGRRDPDEWRLWTQWRLPGFKFAEQKHHFREVFLKMFDAGSKA